MNLLRLGLCNDDVSQLQALGEDLKKRLLKDCSQESLPRLLRRLDSTNRSGGGEIERHAIARRIHRRQVFVDGPTAASKSGKNATSSQSQNRHQDLQTSGESSAIADILDYRKLFAMEHPIDHLGGIVGAKKHNGQHNQYQHHPSALIRVASEYAGVEDPKGGSIVTVDFGSGVKRSLYTLFDEGVFLNAGSYGATPRGVLRAVEIVEALEQRDPVVFEQRCQSQFLPEVTRRLGQFLGCRPQNLALLPNCNTATSTVLKSLPWETDDRILLLSCEYDATMAAVEWLRESYGVAAEIIDVHFPCTEQEVVDALRDRLMSLRRIDAKYVPKLANFCHVSSKTAWMFPVKEMVAVCHEYNVTVLIDGAHAPGHVESLNIDDIGADFYCGTCHKWMFSCQGVAFLAAQQHLHTLIDPLAPNSFLSASSDDSQKRYESGTGCITFAEKFQLNTPRHLLPSLLSLWTAMDFAEYICGGWSAVFAYQRCLAEEAARYLYEEWELEKEGIEDPCIQWSQMGSTGHLHKDRSERSSLVLGHDRASSIHSTAARGIRFPEFEASQKATAPRCIGNCMPLIPIPNSRGATDKDAKRLMGFLLTRFNITCFIVAASVNAYTHRVGIHTTGYAHQQAAKSPSSPAAAEFDGRRGPVAMLVLRFTAQVHVSRADVRTIGAAIRAMQLSAGTVKYFGRNDVSGVSGARKQLAAEIPSNGADRGEATGVVFEGGVD